MGPLDALGHLIGLVLPAVGTGLLAAGLAKLLWRKELAARPWVRLAAWSCGAGAVALVGALVVLGRDGRMLGYAAMLVATALVLWWAGFRPARR